MAPGADENALAAELVRRIKENLAQSARRRSDFAALRGTVLVVAKDTGETITLRFDHGRLTLHDGTIGIPAITFCADRQVLWDLWNTPAAQWLRHPKGVYHLVFKPLVSGRLKIYGLYSRPRMVRTFAGLCAPPPPL